MKVRREGAASATKQLPAKFKILVGMLQLTMNFGRILAIEWPLAIDLTFDFLSFVNLVRIDFAATWEAHLKRLGLTNSAPMCVGGCVAAIAYQIQEVVEEEPVYETELERIQAEAVRPQKTLRLGLLLLRRQNQVACRKGALSTSEFCARRRRLRRRRKRRGRRKSGGRRERRASRRARTWSPRRRRRRLAPADGTSRSRAPNFSLRGCLLGGAAGSDLLPVRWCAD